MDVSTLLKIGAAAAAVAVAATFVLPRTVEVSRSAILPAAPATILSLASSTEGYQRFNPYRTADPALKITPFGPASGVGSGFHFDGKDGKGTQTVAAVGPDAVSYSIDLGPMGQPRQTIRARAVEGSTEVTWSVRADMGMNPMFRVFGLFMDRMMGPTFEQGLANLGQAAV